MRPLKAVQYVHKSGLFSTLIYLTVKKDLDLDYMTT